MFAVTIISVSYFFHFCEAIYKEIWHLTILLVRSFQYLSIFYYYQNIPNGFSFIAIIIFSFIYLFASVTLFITTYIYKEIWHLTISLVMFCQYVSKYSKRFKSYSDINILIKGGRTRLGEAIYKEIKYLTMSLVRLYQYVSACQKLSYYSRWFKSYSYFHKLITDRRTYSDYTALLASFPFGWHYCGSCNILSVLKVIAMFTNWLRTEVRTDGHGDYRTLLVRPPFGILTQYSAFLFYEILWRIYFAMLLNWNVWMI